MELVKHLIKLVIGGCRGSNGSARKSASPHEFAARSVDWWIDIGYRRGYNLTRRYASEQRPVTLLPFAPLLLPFLLSSVFFFSSYFVFVPFRRQRRRPFSALCSRRAPVARPAARSMAWLGFFLPYSATTVCPRDFSLPGDRKPRRGSRSRALGNSGGDLWLRRNSSFCYVCEILRFFRIIFKEE